jgi:F0F1-type ATP synthase assembly protein I
MDNNSTEAAIKQAELRKLQAEIKLIEANQSKAALEASDLEQSHRQRWWHMRASGVLQALIGGIVAGALIAGFMLDHFLKVSDLNARAQRALVEERESLVLRTEQLENKEEESRLTIIALRSENDRLEREATEALARLDELSALAQQMEMALAEAGVAESEDVESLRTRIASSQESFTKVKTQAVSRDLALTGELQQLSRNVEQRSLSTSVTDNWFAVIASPYNEADLKGKLQQLQQFQLDFPVHVYQTIDGRGNPVYTVTLGGYLSQTEAARRVKYARDEGIPSDASSWRSNNWGQNIIDDFP